MASTDRPDRIDFDAAASRWEGAVERAYKSGSRPERGMAWKGVTRHTLMSSSLAGAGFETRYFEVEPGGYSALEENRHVHFVVAVRGVGRALVGDRVHAMSPFDAVYVPPLVPHRWLNAGEEEPFGFLCTVDGGRDR